MGSDDRCGPATEVELGVKTRNSALIRVNAGRRPWLICYWCIPESAMPTPALNVGYYQLNSDTSLNF